MFEFVFYDLLYIPLYNLLIFLYTISPGKDMGLAVIFLTIVIRVVLLPFSIRAARSEHRLQRLQPVIEEVKTRYKYDVQKQREAIKKLLKKNHIGIFSNVFSLAFQILFFVVLYKIFSSGLQPLGHNIIYEFNLDPGVIDPIFMNWFNLIVPNQTASLVAAGVVLLHQAMRKMGQTEEMTTIDRALLFGLPIGTYLATALLPSAKALFIITSVIFSMWIRLIKWFVVKYVIKDEQLKQNVEQLWTS
jgi:YidC/Oxa1 family membrane protein insertase